MKKVMILLVFFMTASWLAAQVPDWLWANQAGGANIDEGLSIATDGNGNSYATGYFVDTATFGSTTLISSGGADVFIAKLDTNGNYLWAYNAGGSSSDYGYAIDTDSDGNCYVAGTFTGTAIIGNTSLTSNGNMDIFITKVDTNGNFLWANKAGGTGNDYGLGIAIDESGNSYFTGRFTDTSTFGSTTLTSSGFEDICIAKLDTNGNYQWARKAGGVSYDIGYGIATDGYGNCNIAGKFSSISIFGNTTLTSSGYYDIFIAKMDSDGNWLWANKAGGTDTDECWSIATDSNGYCNVIGQFAGTSIFGTTTLTSSGSDDIFIAKMDSVGNWLWAKQAGGSGIIDEGCSIDTDDSGNCYTIGRFTGSATFGTTNLISIGGSDIFVSKLDNNGNWLWVMQAGGSGWDFGQDITIDSNGNIYTTGNFQSTATFGSTSITGSGGTFDIYCAKLGNSTSVSDECQVPLPTFSLGQNHPNPFITSTSFEVEVSDAKSVFNVTVYDQRGRLICNLYHGVLPTGMRTFTWNGKDTAENEFSSGVYFYRVSNGTTSQVKKMIYVK